uniref:Uncharacterized protein n=1 Tax=Arundo donax TaxID=35708 RepID=A0A0A9ATZ9_ARUDO
MKLIHEYRSGCENNCEPML